MALRFKPGVDFAGLQPQALFGLAVAVNVYAEAGIECWVTSALDGSVGRVTTSLHPKGLAFDLRLPSRVDGERSVMTDGIVFMKLKGALSTEAERLRGLGFVGTFDAIKHDVGFGDHFHIEWDPSHT